VKTFSTNTKKIIYMKLKIFSIAILTLLLLGCSKEIPIAENTILTSENASSHQQSLSKSNFELSTKDITDIESSFPGLKINIQNNNNFQNTELYTKENTVKFIEELSQKLATSFTNSKTSLKFNKSVSNNARNPWWWEGGEDIPDDGGGTITYTAVVPSGGLFSSFNLTFGYGSGGISSSSLSLQGMSIGWWWNSGYSYNSGNSGYIQGTATYFYGVVTLNFNYTLHYTFSPVDGTITYNWTNP
jgi:hypothetical protein